jgi:hypothetical protein
LSREVKRRPAGLVSGTRSESSFEQTTNFRDVVLQRGIMQFCSAFTVSQRFHYSMCA